MKPSIPWIYISDSLPPRLQLCIVSVRGRHGEPYVDMAHLEDDGEWLNRDLAPIQVYAWCLPTPAEEPGT